MLARALPLLAVLALAAAPGVRAQEVGNVAAGRRLAVEWCGECHTVGPDARRGAVDLAPPFAVVAADPATTAFRLRAFLMTPHDRMPNLQLSRDQIDDMVAYILSLR